VNAGGKGDCVKEEGEKKVVVSGPFFKNLLHNHFMTENFKK
jgi:hypothetical protein